ncbi:MAG: elongation factor G [Myxococcales bacterium]|nr:elongation factor G [Myxococcales bacterium]
MPRDIPLERLRNLGIMAHVDAGKTTLAERLLVFSGRIRRAGEVHDGNTVLDHLPEERRRGITITAAATTVSWTPTTGAQEGVAHRLQLIDTPGHIDFTVEVERSLRVLDGAVFVLDAACGVECQSETVFRQADKHGVPSLVFVNKIDKPGADVDLCVRELRERLGARPALVQLSARGGTVVLDVLRRVALVFEEADRGRTCVPEPLAGEELARVEAARASLVELLAEFDDEVMEGFCAGTEVSTTALERALRKGTLSSAILVVLVGSALKNRGIQPLLDAVVAYLPSPADLPPVMGTNREGAVAVRPHDDEPLVALAFKTVSDRSAGVVSFLRIYAGTLVAGQQVLVSSKGVRERVGRMFLLHAAEREEISEARTGAIVAVTGLRALRTGDTLCAPQHPVVLEAIDAPDPVVEVAIEPRTASDREHLSPAIGRLLVEDPSIRVSTHPETGQMILAGMGQLHLQVVVDRLRSAHDVEVVTGTPRVAYRETVATTARAEWRHVQQNGGAGQFAVVTLVVGPSARGTGVTFVDETVGGVVPREFVPAVEKGVRGAAQRGVFAGHPVTDVVVRLVDGDFHVKDSDAAAFEVAGSRAFQAAVRGAGCVLLEPVAALEVTVPATMVGPVTGDLASRRGLVRGVTPRGSVVVVDGRAPLAATFDYVSRLRGMTGGRGGAMVRVDGYEPVPTALARTLLEAS